MWDVRIFRRITVSLPHLSCALYVVVGPKWARPARVVNTDGPGLGEPGEFLCAMSMIVAPVALKEYTAPARARTNPSRCWQFSAVVDQRLTGYLTASRRPVRLRKHEPMSCNLEPVVKYGERPSEE